MFRLDIARLSSSGGTFHNGQVRVRNTPGPRVNGDIMEPSIHLQPALRTLNQEQSAFDKELTDFNQSLHAVTSRLFNAIGVDKQSDEVRVSCNKQNARTVLLKHAFEWGARAKALGKRFTELGKVLSKKTSSETLLKNLTGQLSNFGINLDGLFENISPKAAWQLLNTTAIPTK